MTAGNIDTPTSREIKVSLLDFDNKNPRFPNEVAGLPDNDLIEKFIKDERLLEIIESIGDQGFFPGEPLLVVKSGSKYKVIEGNRRLAALKLLGGYIDVPSGRPSIIQALEGAAVRPDKVHCLIFAREEQILKYLGFRHITGIKAWNALQKARFMERLLNDSHRNKPVNVALKLLARETGSTTSYLGQSLTALKLYDSAEKQAFYDLKITPDDVEFSLLTTALSYKNIVDYVGLDNRVDINFTAFEDKNLKNLLRWLFVAGENGSPVVRESRMLKHLAAVVAEPLAEKELIRTGNLAEAYELSKGPTVALAEALRIVEKRLNTLLAIIGLIKDTEEVHEKAAEIILGKAEDVHSLIAARRPKRSVRRSR